MKDEVENLLITQRYLIRDREEAIAREEIMRDTLTRCQLECTRLLEENRNLQDRLKQQVDFTLSAQDHAMKAMERADRYFSELQRFENRPTDGGLN